MSIYENILPLTDRQTDRLGAGSNMKLDVALAHPWSSEIFHTSATTDSCIKKRSRKEGQIRQKEVSRKVDCKSNSSGARTFSRWGKQEEDLDRVCVRVCVCVCVCVVCVCGVCVWHVCVSLHVCTGCNGHVD